MSMVCVIKCPHCKTEFSYGRHIPKEGATEFPKPTCPACKEKFTAYREMSRYADEHLEGIEHVHKFILSPKVLF